MPDQLIRQKMILWTEGAPFTGVVPTIDGVDIATVDDIPVSWRNAIQGSPQLIGNDLTATINAGGPYAEGDIVITTDASVLTLGAVPSAPGDGFQLQGGVWVKLWDGVAGFVPADFYCILGDLTDTTLFGTFLPGVDNNKVACFDGTSNTPATLDFDPDGTARADANGLSLTDGTGFMFNNTPTPVGGEWFDVFSPVAGVSSISGGAGINPAGPSTGAVTLSVDPESTPVADENPVVVSIDGVSWNAADATSDTVEADGSGNFIAAVPSNTDKGLTALVASSPGDQVGPAITGVPAGTAGGDYWSIGVNGVKKEVGTALTDWLYFSTDGGTTAVATLAAITTGATLHLGSAAGPECFDFDALDCLDYNYLIFNG
jgi:hypothetical protein